MGMTERKTLHSPHCPECGTMLFCEFSDDELKQLVAGTLSFICTRANVHKSSSDNSWPASIDEKDAFVKVLLAN